MTEEFKAKILTDFTLRELQKIVHKQRRRVDYQVDRLMMCVSSMANIAQSVLPAMGNQFETNVIGLRNLVERDRNSEFSNIDYMTGIGPVGSYIREQIYMTELIFGDHSLQTRSDDSGNPEFASEYSMVFNLCPKTNRNDDEYRKTRDLISKLWHFGFNSKFYKLLKYKSVLLESTLEVDQPDIAEQISFRTPLTNSDEFVSGIYRKAQAYSTYSVSEHGAMVLVTSVNDTKVCAIIDMSVSHGDVGAKIYYYHRGEGRWISETDNRPSDRMPFGGVSFFYLEGIYDALYAEANKLLHSIDPVFELNMLDQTYQLLAEDALKKIKRIQVCASMANNKGYMEEIDKLFDNFRYSETEFVVTMSFISGPFKHILYRTIQNNVDKCWNYMIDNRGDRNNAINEPMGMMPITISSNDANETVHVNYDQSEITAIFALTQFCDGVDDKIAAMREIIERPQASEEKEV